jgi:predicted nucleotidyltransferase component of viral defense system
VLGRNWTKIDVTREAPTDRIANRKLSQSYSDYPPFRIRTESVEEIGAEKIRSLVERKKCRDYYDVWQLMKLKIDKGLLGKLLVKKFEYKGMKIKGSEEIFPPGLSETLRGYWERELSRLIHPLPEMKAVIRDLEVQLKPILKQYAK